MFLAADRQLGKETPMDDEARAALREVLKHLMQRSSNGLTQLLHKYPGLINEKIDGVTLLCEACASSCNVAIVRQLLEKGACPNIECDIVSSQYILPPLLEATKRGNEEVVATLLQYGADCSVRDSTGKTAVMIACSLQEYEVLGEFIRFKCDLEARDSCGRTALSRACTRRDLQAVSMLVDGGADPNTRDDRGNTPLAHACMNGGEDIAQYLLHHNADPNMQDNDGFTPLMRTCNACVLEVTGLRIALLHSFLQHGANIRIRNNQGKCAYEIAKRFRHAPELIALMERWDAKSRCEICTKRVLLLLREVPGTSVGALPPELLNVIRSAAGWLEFAATMSASR